MDARVSVGDRGEAGWECEADRVACTVSILYVVLRLTFKLPMQPDFYARAKLNFVLPKPKRASARRLEAVALRDRWLVDNEGA